ncbi:MAG: hypothetical protein ACP5QO_11695, partial [Clostridia bacterium]
AGWKEVVHVARVTLHVLDQLRLPVALKTSGAEGLHLFLPIQLADPHRVEDAVERIARVVNLTLPEESTVVRRVKDRGPRVYIDYLQNGPKRTMAAVYSARAVPDARVSWPIRAEELDGGPTQFTVRSVLEGPVRAFVREHPVDLDRALGTGGLPSLAELRRITPDPRDERAEPPRLPVTSERRSLQ